MRKIGTITSSESAKRFVGYLGQQGIEAEVREDRDGAHGVWIIEEDLQQMAENELHSFLSNPQDERYARVRPVLKSHSEEFGPPQVDARTQLLNRPEVPSTSGFATIALIVLSVLATLIVQNEGTQYIANKLFYGERMARDFWEIKQGQIWRLVTPIFMHGGYGHLFFNMIWLFQLGTMVEANENSLFLLVQTLILGVICNTSQYLVSGPAFLGMSGVVFGLFGFVWMMARYRSGSSTYFMPKQTVVLMIIWLVICLLGIFPNAANTEHVMGLIVGLGWGFLQSGGARNELRKRRFKNRL